MTWALCSTMEDMVSIEAGFKELGLSPQNRTKLRGYWNGGLSGWRTAPCIPAEHPCFATDGVESIPGGTCMRAIVCTFGTVADFRALLQALIGTNPEANYFIDFLTGKDWYCVEPWPTAPGQFTGMRCA